MSLVKNILIINFTAAFVINACTYSGGNSSSYPQPNPDSTPIKYLPGIVTSDKLDFNSAFSPDGKDFYFGRSEHGKWVMYVTTFDGSKWSQPVHPPFGDTAYSEADPFFTPDGSLYYISTRPKDNKDTIKDYDIWMVKPIDNNKWSMPLNIAIANSDSNELYISFAANQNLYFSSSRQGGFGQEDIYVCKYENGKYAQPVNLGEKINSTGSDHDPLITKDEKYLIFSTSDRKDGYGQADLYFSKQNTDGTWRKAANLGKRFNTPTYEYCSYLTADGKYFFYSTDSDIKWIKADYLFKDMERRNQPK